MKGKINQKGVLLIQRGNEYLEMDCVNVACSYMETNTQGSQRDSRSEYRGYKVCSHECAHFGEPYPSVDWDDKTETAKPNGRTNLELCGIKTLAFDEFVDERPKGTKNAGT